MGGGGGKGGGQTQKVEIPKWIEEPATRNLARAEAAQKIGYQPYYGPDVAAFNPTQLAAMQSNIGAAEAFGLLQPGQMTAAQGMPPPTTYVGGFQGYGSGNLYDQAVAEFEKRRPGQASAYNALFVDPYSAQAANQAPAAAAAMSQDDFAKMYAQQKAMEGWNPVQRMIYQSTGSFDAANNMMGGFHS